MKADQLQQIIKGKNEQLERHVLRNAEAIIENIVQQQQAIAAANTQIQKLREELQSLQIVELDPKAILGEA